MKARIPAAVAIIAAMLTLAGCVSSGPGVSSNPVRAASLQACKDFAAWQELAFASPSPEATKLASFLVSPSGKVNTNVAEPLRHDLAGVMTAVANDSDKAVPAASAAFVDAVKVMLACNQLG